VCFDFVYKYLSETFLNLKRNERDMIKKSVLVSIESTLSCPILMKLECSRQIFEISSNTKFHEICPVGAELFHSDGRTDMTTLTIAFRNFANAPKYER